MEPETTRAITLDDLVALSDEIRALARAGVPLESGLKALARDLPGRLGRLTSELGQRLEAGEKLTEVLRADGRFPPAYRAVVEAGIRSGRLPVALEGIATTSRRAAEMRRLCAASLIYPLFVIVVATVLIHFTLLRTQPVVLLMLREFDGMDPMFQTQETVARMLVAVLPVISMLLVLTAVVWFVQSRRGTAFASGGLGPFAPISKLVLEGQRATFADLLALLIEQQVPLVEAIPLAAEATGNRRFNKAGVELAEQLRRGAQPVRYPKAISPFLGWMLSTQAASPGMVAALRRLAAHHRQRFSELAVWIGVYIPILLSAGVGGLLALFYVLLVLGPFYHLLQILS